MWSYIADADPLKQDVALQEAMTAHTEEVRCLAMGKAGKKLLAARKSVLKKVEQGLGADVELATTLADMLSAGEAPPDPVAPTAEESPLQFVKDNDWKAANFPDHTIVNMTQYGLCVSRSPDGGRILGCAIHNTKQFHSVDSAFDHFVSSGYHRKERTRAELMCPAETEVTVEPSAAPAQPSSEGAGAARVRGTMNNRTESSVVDKFAEALMFIQWVAYGTATSNGTLTAEWPVVVWKLYEYFQGDGGFGCGAKGDYPGFSCAMERRVWK
jgi:hypothetical protein